MHSHYYRRHVMPGITEEEESPAKYEYTAQAQEAVIPGPPMKVLPRANLFDSPWAV